MTHGCPDIRRRAGRRSPAMALCAALALPSPLAASQAEPASTLAATRVHGDIRLDGRLDEAAWAQAPVLADFTQLTPLLGKPSPKRTEVRVLHDDRYLYVSARMHHEPGKADVVRQVHRRDQVSASDWFAVFLDCAHDHRVACSFMVNASNVQRDGLHYDEGGEDWSWDGVWDSEVSVDQDGWTAELRIPLSILRIHEASGTLTWGANFARRDEGREREASYWYVAPRDATGWVSHFHHLEGLAGLKPRPRREWIPYVSTERKFETAQGWDDRKWTHRAGLDAHLGVNGYSQLDLSVRPDFGQVEVDQAILNLSTVETFLPEKRPFFLEGMELFELSGARLFYSRRIGKGLQGPDDPSVVVDWPRAAEIAAAGKFTTKTPGGLSLGILGAGAEAARATLRDEAGGTFKEELSPWTSAGVLRASQTLDDRGSRVGAFASVLRQAGASGRAAAVTALDGAWRSADRSVLLEGLFAHSDAGVRGKARQGNLLTLHSILNWGQGWSLDLNAFTVSRRFNPNDLGYLDRPDKKGASMELTRRWDVQKGLFRNPTWSFNASETRDQAGRTFPATLETWARTEFVNDWSILAGGGWAPAADDGRELRAYDQPVKKYLHLPPCQWLFWGVDSPPNALWSASSLWLHGKREGGAKDQVTLINTFKPMPRLELVLESRYARSAGELHWVETQGDTPIVGMRKLSQLDQILRIAYAFSPRMTVQVFSQWMAATWNYRDIRSYVDDRTLAPGAVASVPLAYSERLWNLNLIARWEFRPGSSVYLVYTHGAWTGELINERASLSPRRDLDVMGHLPSDDVLQLKLSWLFR